MSKFQTSDLFLLSPRQSTKAEHHKSTIFPSFIKLVDKHFPLQIHWLRSSQSATHHDHTGSFLWCHRLWSSCDVFSFELLFPGGSQILFFPFIFPLHQFPTGAYHCAYPWWSNQYITQTSYARVKMAELDPKSNISHTQEMFNSLTETMGPNSYEPWKLPYDAKKNQRMITPWTLNSQICCNIATIIHVRIWAVFLSLYSMLQETRMHLQTLCQFLNKYA